MFYFELFFVTIVCCDSYLLYLMYLMSFIFFKVYSQRGSKSTIDIMYSRYTNERCMITRMSNRFVDERGSQLLNVQKLWHFHRKFWSVCLTIICVCVCVDSSFVKLSTYFHVFMCFENSLMLYNYYDLSDKIHGSDYCW